MRPRRRGGPRSGRGAQVRPGDHQPRLHRLEEQRARAAPSRCSRGRSSDDPLHSVEARNNIAQILRDKARKASSSEEKKSYVGQAVSNLRTVLALDSNNLQAFSTLAFIYYDMNMLEMAKLVGNQAIKKAEEIATGKFEEEKVEEASEGKAAGGKGKGKGAKGGKEKADDRAATRRPPSRRRSGARRAPASPAT